jgi:hypothetical protein
MRLELVALTNLPDQLFFPLEKKSSSKATASCLKKRFFWWAVSTRFTRETAI